MKSRSLLAGLIMGLLTAGSALAFEPFVVRDIRVEGIQRTEPGTVFSYLPVRVGDRFTREQAAQSIRDLFATGFFSDVQIEEDNGVLVVLVDERPAIAEIEFVGLKEFEKDALLAGLAEVGIAEARTFDRSLVERAEQELKRQYLSRSKYGVDIRTTVTPLERNRVALTFEVDEGDIARIREIRIVGARAFEEDDLLDLFQLTTPGWLTWYTRNDRYSRQKLSADLETLRTFYLDQGYIDFNIDATQVSISPDKQDIYITVNITEGAQYTVSGLRFSGELIVDEARYRELVRIVPGEVFSRERLNETTTAVSDLLANEGYAFANVNAVPDLDREARTVDFTVVVDPGRRVYVRRINIGGNTRTRDEVVRREMRQMEATWYDAAAINRSRQRIERLGYFDEVAVDTAAVPGTTDQVDVNFSLKERATGNLLLGAGFSSADSVVLSASVSQQNLFGSGNSLSFGLNTSPSRRTLSLSFTNPYFTVDGISLGWDAYHRTTDPSETTSIARYKTTSTGAGLRLGYPVTEDDRINFGLSVDRTKIETFDNSPQTYKDFCNDNDFDCNSLTSLLLTASWARDKRDSFIYPRSGVYQRVFAEASIPPAELQYIKAGYEYQYWLPIGRLSALMLNTELGYARGIGDHRMPFFKNFYVGGLGTVRGFEQNALGPRDSEDDALGGTRKLVANAELFFPMPGTGNDRSMRLSWFVDAGYVWGEDEFGEQEELRFTDLRYSSGLSFGWSSPVGPLKFSIGFPIKKEDDDKLQRFQFQLGSVF